MNVHDVATETDKADISRFLQPRLTALLGRCNRLAGHGHDLNLLHLLASEAADLAAACRYIDAAALAGMLAEVHAKASACLQEPDRAAASLPEMAALLEQARQQRIETSAAAAVRPIPVRNGFPTALQPTSAQLAHYRARERRSSDAPVAAMPASAPPAPPTPAPARPAPPATPGPQPVQDVAIHFRNRGEFDAHVDTTLASLGYEVKHADDIDTLARQLAVGGVRVVFSAELDRASIAALGEHVSNTRRGQPQLNWIVAGDEDERLDQRRSALRAGADAFIAIPINEAALQQRLVEHASDHSENPFRIMIIDDDPAQAMFSEAILRQAGMHTLAVLEPRQALVELDVFRPELILMDLYMPNCNGMELTALIRQHDRHAGTPILFLSGANDDDIQFEALNVGADGFLSKPMRPRHLITAVRSHVRRARQLRASLGGAAATSAPGAAPAAAPPGPAVASPSTLLDHVRQALDSDGLRLAFQPILSLRGDEGAQFQALLRLRGRGDEEFTAAQIIAAARPAGLMSAIDRWVLQRCVRVLGTRRGGDRLRRLFVNQALDSLVDEDFPARLDALMQATPLREHALVIELGIADALDASDHATALGTLLGQHGIGLLLADVTADDAHLQALQLWNPHWLRLAPHYSRSDQPALRGELTALVNTAHADGRTVVAPHVEDARTTAMLWGVGVDVIQGHFIQQPADDLDFDFRAATAHHLA